jgi:hypothetical protein
MPVGRMLGAMIWRAGEQVVARHGDSFVLLSARGELVGRFAPSSFSDEGDRWRTAQRVVGTELQERTTIDRRSGEARVYEEKVLLRGLQPVDDEATRRLVAGALAAVESASARAQAERERVAEGRVTAIDGAYEALGVEPAQAALRRRIHDWDDQRAASLLRTLIALGRARVEAAVLEVFARGCLLACFESPADASTAGSQGSPRPELAEEISALARALEADAEGQELSDALRNAAAFRRAAAELRRAAELLANGGR